MRYGADTSRGKLSNGENGSTDPSTLPAGWTLATIDAVAERVVDCEHSTAKFVSSGMPCVDTTCIKPGQIVKDKLRYVDRATYELRTRRLIPEEGDIIFAREGTVGTAVRVPTGMQLCLGQRVMLLRPGEAVISAYLENVLNSNATRKQYLTKIIGSTAPHLNVRDVRELTVPVPPLNEQRRIVTAIEANLTRLDAGVANLERVRAKLKRYRAAVLKAACVGRLVPTEAELARAEGRPYEPADRLLARILEVRTADREEEKAVESDGQARRSRKARTQANLHAQRPISSLFLPEGWSSCPVSVLLDGFRAGSTAVPVDDETPFPILRSSSVRPGAVDFSDARFLPAELGDADENRLQENDLLFVRLSGSLDYVGCCAMVRGLNDRRIHYPDRLFRAKVTRHVFPAFLELYFQSPDARSTIKQAAKSTAGHQRISMGAITEHEMPLPPDAEQHRIVAEVERRLSLIDELDAAASSNLKRSDRLRQSILKCAFEGKLVPQDPADEPAEALLERIAGVERQAVLFDDAPEVTMKGRRPRRSRRG